MRKIETFELFNESKEYKNDIDSIIEIMLELIDDGYNPLFKSNFGDMRFSDYSDKNSKYENFKPVYKAGNKIKSRFSIVFHRLEDYDKVVKSMDEMKSPIGRLSEINWKMNGFKVGTTNSNTNEFGFSFLSYVFTKDDVITGDELPTEKNIEKEFNDRTSLVTHKGDIYIYDKYVDIGFESKTYDGDIPKDIDEQFDKLCDILGFSEYEYDKWGVRFWYN